MSIAPSRIETLSVPPAPETAPEGPVLIEASGVSKQFLRRSGQAGDLRERFTQWRNRKAAPQSNDTFWALQDVSFQVKQGEAVGIVGHNGSGKSTLLKMLTSILKPTSGQVSVHGRVGALIEVGAGFHPDLTGRENIFLNGSILGMSRREIQDRLDRIVEFAGLEAFIDTPVKRYSSGMYMRLGFSVAAHTDPDILLIDEVLAVGDLLFQRKCLRHLQQWVAKGGTLVFVSHAMDQMQTICQKCVWLDHGQVLYQGPTEQAIERYLAMVSEREDAEYRRMHPADWEARQAEEAALVAQEEADREALRQEAEQLVLKAQTEQEERIALQNRRETARRNDPRQSCLLDCWLTDANGNRSEELAGGQACQVHVRYRVPTARKNLVIGFEVLRDDDLYMFAASNYQYHQLLPTGAGVGELHFDIPMLALNQGTYRLRLSLFPEPDIPGWDTRPEHVKDSAATFRVVVPDVPFGCAYLPISSWQVTSTQEAAS